MNCDNNTIYERLIQIALRESIVYGTIRSIWETADGVLLIRSIHVPMMGDKLLGQTIFHNEIRWIYNPIKIEEVAPILVDQEQIPNSTLYVCASAAVGRGTWTLTMLQGQNGQGIITAYIRCPQCGKPQSLKNHTINESGLVHPELVCPYSECDFHGQIMLNEWECS